MNIAQTDYQVRVEQDTQWIWELNHELEQWLEMLRHGHIYGVIPSAARWYQHVAEAMKRRRLDEVPEALRANQRIHDAAYEALENHRVQFFSHEAPGWHGLPHLWLSFFIIELHMPEDEYVRLAEAHREYLLEQWAQRQKSEA